LVILNRKKGINVETEVIDRLRKCLQSETPVALMTIIEHGNSSPGKIGAMMVVWGESESCGTVGGGNFEFWAIAEAKKCLAAGVSREVSFSPEIKDKAVMSCGGETRLFIRVFYGGPRLIIVGGGHVGLELYHIALNQGFKVTVIDDREEIVDHSRFPDADTLLAADIAEGLFAYPITDRCFITIATRTHETDERALSAAVRSDAAYIGVIGSSRKIKEIFQHLLEQGVSREKLDGVYAPMGLNIATRKPKEIALSIMAEIFLVKNSGSAEHMRSVKNINF